MELLLTIPTEYYYCCCTSAGIMKYYHCYYCSSNNNNNLLLLLLLLLLSCWHHHHHALSHIESILWFNSGMVLTFGRKNPGGNYKTKTKQKKTCPDISDSNLKIEYICIGFAL